MMASRVCCQDHHPLLGHGCGCSGQKALCRGGSRILWGLGMLLLVAAAQGTVVSLWTDPGASPCAAGSGCEGRGTWPWRTMKMGGQARIAMRGQRLNRLGAKGGVGMHGRKGLEETPVQCAEADSGCRGGWGEDGQEVSRYMPKISRAECQERWLVGELCDSVKGCHHPGNGQGERGGLRMRLRGGADEQKVTGKRQRIKRPGSGSDPEKMKDGDDKFKGFDELDVMADTSAVNEGSGGADENSGSMNVTVKNNRNRLLLDEVKELTSKLLEARKMREASANATTEVKLKLVAIKQELEVQQQESVKVLKDNLLDLLDWRGKMKRQNVSGIAQNDKYPNANICTHIRPDEGTVDCCFDCQTVTGPPDFSRGGFACVIIDKEVGIAYRLEPMTSDVDAAAWLGFHSVLEFFGVRAALSVHNDKPRAVLLPDFGMTNKIPYDVWNETSIVRLYQEPTLAAFSKHVLKNRNRLCKRHLMETGGIVAVNDEENRKASRILTPRAFFQHTVQCPIFADDEKKGIEHTDYSRRLRGKELAEVLCGKTAFNPHVGDWRSVKLLCTVFDLATGGDLATMSRGLWRSGAPPDVPERVVCDIGQALRCMHACGIAHGDVKMANILIMGDGAGFWLGDLPALTRATTKMLTNDPVCSTHIKTGKRMLANDMWGLGLITMTLIAGFVPFKKACDKLKSIPAPALSGPLWVVFIYGFIDTLRLKMPEVACLEDCRENLEEYICSDIAKNCLRTMTKDQRLACRKEGELVAYAVFKNRAAGANVWKQLAYCFDISNVARNALAMPLPGEVEAPPYGLTDAKEVARKLALRAMKKDQARRDEAYKEQMANRSG